MIAIMTPMLQPIANAEIYNVRYVTTWNVATKGPQVDNRINCKLLDEDQEHNQRRLIRNIEKLTEISHFKSNWNGYGAQPLDDELIERARQLIQEIEVQPEIFPTADNSMQAEWQKPGGEYLEIQIVLGSRLPVFLVDAENSEHEGFIDADSKYINRLVDDFYAGTTI